eukprot:scaffold2707_cov90-Skeletonema_dohrnii-CCMP3373.AAC.1
MGSVSSQSCNISSKAPPIHSNERKKVFCPNASSRCPKRVRPQPQIDDRDVRLRLFKKVPTYLLERYAARSRDTRYGVAENRSSAGLSSPLSSNLSLESQAAAKRCLFISLLIGLRRRGVT